MKDESNQSILNASNWHKTSYMERSIMSARQNFGMTSAGADQSGKGKMDFEHFLKFLEIVASKIFPSIDISLAFQYLIEDFILPLLQNKKLAESRCVQNNQILDLVSKIESDDMVEFLTLLHKSIMKYYVLFADS